MVKRSRLYGGAVDNATEIPDAGTPAAGISKTTAGTTPIDTNTSNAAPTYPQFVIPMGKMQVPASVMEQNGLPWMLAQHPNNYSRNDNEVILYNSAIAFMGSAFYAKYKDRLVYVKSITLYSDMGNKTTQQQDIPGKDYRFVFRSSAFTDNDIFYLDPKDADEYIDIWLQIKDLPFLQPVEFESFNAMKRNQQATAVSMGDMSLANKNGYEWGLYDEAVIKNKDIDQRDQLAAINQNARDQVSAANINASYYQGKSEGQTEGAQDAAASSGSSDGLGDVLGFIGLGFKPKKHKKKVMDKALHKSIESFIRAIK